MWAANHLLDMKIRIKLKFDDMEKLSLKIVS